eukprot:CAMPEP_0114421018 /NCGR_PEP_ID=MMETSP0103-20121206/4859_1 /TAXON_ID=37642 ORGANISM="Paraphysomonas imperforata, Strain PA2" /NCGR_SAMPLE_ID=MMETSP0103 /ASSEMBLY_ACC=CAM_ASM_000201 /LENGTH=189 /DNA_ID=CAMNT_0001589521 /DNA_START=18 /DNA_END=587 /DNA_ORIENTATION=+
MSLVDKNGVFLFGVVACAAAAFRWHISQRLDGDEHSDDVGMDNSSERSEDSLDEYFDDHIDYQVRDDYEMGDGRFKMVLLVNMKLSMGKGKIAAQCGHATLGAYELSKRHCRSALKCWFQAGTAKIALKAADDSALLEIQRKATQAGLVSYLVHDAGHTQIPAGSMTVLALGPAPYDVCDSITGKLKLL